MGSEFNKMIREFVDTIKTPNAKPSPYDTQAEVQRVDGDIAWVHIPGGVDETPVQLTTNAKKGDIVQVRVSGGRAWLYGNQTSPPTDDSKANQVENDLIKTEVKVYETITITEKKIYNEIEAARAHIDELIAEKADITDLNAATARIGTLETDNASIKGRLTTAEADIDTLDANKATITDLNAATARIGTLETTKADITDLNAATARIGTLETDNTSIKGRLTAAEADIDTLDAEKATITDLNAATARIGTLETDNTNIKGRLTAAEADIDTLDANKATITDLNAATARIGTLETDNTSIKGRLTAAEADIDTLDAEKADIADLNAATARIGTLEADHVSVSDFEAEQANIDNLQAATADIDTIRANSAKVQNLTAAQLEADHATIGALDTNYAQIDLANVNNAWIQNGVVKNAAIGDAQISGVSANKLTAGTIDASNITVTNLNADNITTGTINGQRIGAGSLSLDKLSEDVYTEQEVDNKLRDIQLEIDGAIETYTGTVVPTLNNTPASSWTTTDLKNKHVGDIYYVVNNNSQQNGYCYRFTKSGNVYSWTLIKDSDVTAALQRLTEAEGDISGLQQFETTTSSWISNTDTELNSLKTRTTNVETSLGDKVSTSTFNELSQTVDENTASITSLGETVETKADSSTVTTLSNTVNTVQQTANGNSSKISSLTTTLGTNADGTTKAGDVVHRTSAVEQDLSGFKTTVSNTYATKTALNDKADADDLDALTTRVSTAETTITQQAGQISLKANSSDVYTKTATNNLLADKADADDVYTKDDIDDEFALYTKTADFSVAPGQIQSTITNAVAGKANSSDVYTKTQIDQTVNGINTTVSSKVGNDEVISRINQSSESITIDANRVNIAGAAIFDNYSLKSQTVSNVVVEYAKSNSATSQPTSGWSTNTPTWEAGKYIWQRTGKTINGTTTYTYTCIQGAKGDIGPTAQWYYGTALSHTSGTATMSTSSTSGVVVGCMYLNTTYDYVYKCTAISGTTATWTYAGNLTPSNILGKTQSIYKRTNSSTAPSVPTSVITATTDQGTTGNWTLMHMPRVASSNTAYKYLWTCEQLISVGGELLGHTTVVADNGTTVIDGGDIQTGTVSADRLNVNDIITKGSIVVSGDNISKLNNNSGYQTLSQVDTAITSKGYQTSSQVETAITSKGYQTASQVDTAISTATSDMATNTSVANTYAAKTAAVSEQQRIYYRSSVNTKPNGNGLPTTWVTETGDKYNSNATTASGWSRKVTPMANGTGSSVTKYPYLWTCIQKKTVSGTVTYGDILLDDGITVIDGGKIITGSVTANQIDATNLHVSSANIDGDLTIGKITNLQTTLDGKATQSYADGKANAAAWTVSIEVSSINYSTPTATLVAKPYYYGALTTSGVTYQWAKNGTNISGATSNSYTATDFNASYTCTIS